MILTVSGRSPLIRLTKLTWNIKFHVSSWLTRSTFGVCQIRICFFHNTGATGHPVAAAFLLINDVLNGTTFSRRPQYVRSNTDSGHQNAQSGRAWRHITEKLRQPSGSRKSRLGVVLESRHLRANYLSCRFKMVSTITNIV